MDSKEVVLKLATLSSLLAGLLASSFAYTMDQKVVQQQSANEAATLHMLQSQGYKSIYKFLLPALSDEHCAELLYLIEDDLLKYKPLERQVIFIKYVLQVLASNGEQYTMASIGSRLEQRLTTHEDAKVMRDRLDELLSSPIIPNDSTAALCASLMTYLVAFAASDTSGAESVDYEQLGHRQKVAHNLTLAAVKRLQPPLKLVVRDCIKELYRLCVQNVSNEALEKEIQNKALVFANLALRETGAESIELDSTLAEAFIADFDKILDALPGNYLATLVLMCANPYLDATVVRGLVLKLLILAPEKTGEYESSLHALFKKLVRVSCLRNQEDRAKASMRARMDVVIANLERFLEGQSLPKPHSLYFIGKKTTLSAERKAALTQLVNTYKQMFSRTNMQSPSAEFASPSSRSESDDAARPPRKRRLAGDDRNSPTALDRTDEIAKMLLSEAEVNMQELNPLIEEASKKGDAISLHKIMGTLMQRLEKEVAAKKSFQQKNVEVEIAHTGLAQRLSSYEQSFEQEKARLNAVIKDQEAAVQVKISALDEELKRVYNTVSELTDKLQDSEKSNQALAMKAQKLESTYTALQAKLQEKMQLYKQIASQMDLLLDR